MYVLHECHIPLVYISFKYDFQLKYDPGYITICLNLVKWNFKVNLFPFLLKNLKDLQRFAGH